MKIGLGLRLGLSLRLGLDTTLLLLLLLRHISLTCSKTWGSIKNIHLSYFRNLKFVFSVLICSFSVFCILALGSGQRLLYRLGSGLVLVLVIVLRFCAYSDGGVYS